MSHENKVQIKELRFGKIQIENRADSLETSRTIVGYAAKYDLWSDPIWGYFIEKIERGAFDDCDFSDCIATFNHNIDNVMARTSSGTLQIILDETGLRFSFEAPNTTMGNDMLEMVRRGDVSQCSFVFVIENEEWCDNPKNEYQERKLIKISKVYDVSLVTYPAYPDTEVSTARAAIERRCNEALSQSAGHGDMLQLTIAKYKYNK